MNSSKYTSDINDADNMTGLEFEEFCSELLKKIGYKNVNKTPASGDFGLDIIATTSEGFKCGIQCKNYKGSVGIAAVQEAISGCQYYGCDIAIVLTNSTFTRQAADMAARTRVKLWDRKTLKELIKVFPQKQSGAQGQYNTTNTNNSKPALLSIGEVDIMTHHEFTVLCRQLLKYEKFRNPYYIANSNRNIIYTDRNGIKYIVRYMQKEIYIIDVINCLTEKIVHKRDLLMMITNKGITEDAEIKAKKNNVVIWDRKKLESLLKTFPKEDYTTALTWDKETGSSTPYGANKNYWPEHPARIQIPKIGVPANKLGIAALISVLAGIVLKSASLMFYKLTILTALVTTINHFLPPVAIIVSLLEWFYKAQEHNDNKKGTIVGIITSIIAGILVLLVR